MRSLRVRRAGLAAVLAVAIGYASVPPVPGWAPLSHFALVRALSHGTPVIDRYQSETGDISWYKGHYYTAKAPGVAFLTVGPYLALEHTGLIALGERVTGRSHNLVALWELGIIGAGLAVALVLLLIRKLGDDMEPGLGTAAAVTSGLGTLLLPFATILFDHALSAALGFAAFALLWRRGDRLVFVLAAGLLAGYAVTTEYPLGVVAVGLGLYVISRGDALRRGAVYAAGVVVGTLPLFAYNWWAFGSPTHLPYEDVLVKRGITGHDVLGANERGFFGISWPRPSVAVDLLFGRLGLLMITPVMLAGAAGLVLLYRRGNRREALLVIGLALAYLLYNTGYERPLGGFSPGPRYLMPVIPFLSFPLAFAYRRWPWATFALAIPSAIVMVGTTVTNPTKVNAATASVVTWVHRLADGTFADYGLRPEVPALVFFATGGLLAVAVTRLPRPTRHDLVAAGSLSAAWALIVLSKTGAVGGATAPFLALGLMALVIGGIAAHQARRRPAAAATRAGPV